MKKIIILIISIFLFKNVYSFYYENGGLARVIALGFPEIAISDILLNYDLFSKGFISIAHFKPINNKIIFNAGFYPNIINEKNIKIKNTNFFLNDEIKNHNIFFKLNDENIITIVLNADEMTSEYEESNEDVFLFNSVKSSETKIVSGIGYSKKINKNIALGLFLNDNYIFYKIDKYFEKGLEDNEPKIYEISNSNYSKVNYGFSIAYFVNENLSFSLLVGDKKLNVPFILNEIKGLTLFNPSEIEIDYENIFFNRYNILFTKDTLRSEITYDERTFLKEQKESFGYNLNFGMELNKENIKASIVAEILLNCGYKYNKYFYKEINYHYFPPKSTEEEYFNSQYIINSSAHIVEITFKYFINEILTFANIFNYFFEGFDYNFELKSCNIKLMQYNIVPAFSIKFFKMLILFEFFLKNFHVENFVKNELKHIDNSLFIYGFKTGIEYEIENDVFLRIGYNLRKGGSGYIEKNEQNLIDEKAGTAYNPFLIRSTFSFGIGHKFEEFEVNLCFLNEEIFKIPSSNNYQNRSNQVVFDLKKFF